MPKKETKATKSVAKKTKTPAKKTVKKTTRAKKVSVKRITTKKTARPITKSKAHQSKDKLAFFLGLLIIVTGASIMIEVLSLSFSADASNMTKDLFLFPIAIIFLLLGIGMVVNRSLYLKN